MSPIVKWNVIDSIFKKIHLNFDAFNKSFPFLLKLIKSNKIIFR